MFLREGWACAGGSNWSYMPDAHSPDALILRPWAHSQPASSLESRIGDGIPQRRNIPSQHITLPAQRLSEPSKLAPCPLDKLFQGRLFEPHFRTLCTKEQVQKALPGVGSQEVLPPFCLLHHLPLSDPYLLPECRVPGKRLISPFTWHRLSMKSRDPSVLLQLLLAMCLVRKAIFCHRGLGYGQAASPLWRMRNKSVVVSDGDLETRVLGGREPRRSLASTSFPACI